MAELSERFFNMIVSKGLLMRYAKNDVIWVPPEGTGSRDEEAIGGAPCERTGIFIVIAGLVSRSFKEADGRTEVRHSRTTPLLRPLTSGNIFRMKMQYDRCPGSTCRGSRHM